MGLSVGVLKETFPGERRVALTPKVVDMLTKVGAEVWIETGAGIESGNPDEEYTARGAKVVSLADVCGSASVLLTVRAPEPDGLKKGQVRHRLLRSFERSGHRGEVRAGGRHTDFDGISPAHHARAKHGRAIVDGIDRRL